VIKHPESIPSIRVYRDPDTTTYLFMELAEVDPGHYVGYGQLQSMTRGDIEKRGLDFVIKSLETFFDRDGKKEANA
jgi:hypothetical protein